MGLIDKVIFSLEKLSCRESIEGFINLTGNDGVTNEWLKSNQEGLNNVLRLASEFLKNEYDINVKQDSLIIDSSDDSGNVGCFEYQSGLIVMCKGFLKRYYEDYSLAVGDLVHELVHKYRRELDVEVMALFSDYHGMIRSSFTATTVGPYYYGNLEPKSKSLIRDLYYEGIPFDDLNSWFKGFEQIKSDKGLHKFLRNWESAWLLRYYLTERPAINAGTKYYSIIKGISQEEALRDKYADRLYAKLITDFNPLIVTLEPDLTYYKRLLNKGLNLIKKERKIE